MLTSGKLEQGASYRYEDGRVFRLLHADTFQVEISNLEDGRRERWSKPFFADHTVRLPDLIEDFEAQSLDASLPHLFGVAGSWRGDRVRGLTVVLKPDELALPEEDRLALLRRRAENHLLAHTRVVTFPVR